MHPTQCLYYRFNPQGRLDCYSYDQFLSILEKKVLFVLSTSFEPLTNDGDEDCPLIVYLLFLLADFPPSLFSFSLFSLPNSNALLIKKYSLRDFKISKW